jgi:hypothetical protein
MAGRSDVVRIAAGASRGTGFLIDESRVLTALHVVGTAIGGVVTLHGPVRVEGALSESGRIRSVVALLDSIEGMRFDAALDWICLRVEGLEALARPRIRAPRAADATAEWRTYGFPREAPDDGKSAGGRCRSIDAVVRIRGKQQPVLQVFAEELGAGDNPGGFSGAPLFVGDEVVGMFFSAPERADSGTLYALPVAPLLAHLFAPAGLRPLTLCLAELALPARAASAALVTDDPDRLAGEVATWPAWLATSALRPSAESDRIRHASLAALLNDPPLRRELLQRKLSTASFELYVYHAPAPDPRIRETLLFQRLRKRRPPLARIEAREDVAVDVAAAVARIAAEDRRTVTPPALVRPRAALVALADLALGIVVRYLATPDDALAGVEFEFVRTRLRLALDVISGVRNRREQNPLP